MTQEEQKQVIEKLFETLECILAELTAMSEKLDDLSVRVSNHQDI